MHLTALWPSRASWLYLFLLSSVHSRIHNVWRLAPWSPFPPPLWLLTVPERFWSFDDFENLSWATPLWGGYTLWVVKRSSQGAVNSCLSKTARSRYQIAWVEMFPLILHDVVCLLLFSNLLASVWLEPLMLVGGLPTTALYVFISYCLSCHFLNIYTGKPMASNGSSVHLSLHIASLLASMRSLYVFVLFVHLVESDLSLHTVFMFALFLICASIYHITASLHAVFVFVLFSYLSVHPYITSQLASMQSCVCLCVFCDAHRWWLVHLQKWWCFYLCFSRLGLCSGLSVCAA